MTTREARGLAAVDTEEESIASYLQRNPEFFERHQAVLARLKLPHARGGSTISLVERQIEVLREKQAALENKLAELVRVGAEPDPSLPSFVRTVKADDAHLKSFESLFTSGKPRCGQARDSQREFLFGPEGLEMASVALVP